MSASPGTTGPALIFTSRAETVTGAPTGVVEVLVVPASNVPCPATGKFVLPSGATATPAEPVKNIKYAATPSPRTTSTTAAMMRERCILFFVETNTTTRQIYANLSLIFSECE